MKILNQIAIVFAVCLVGEAVSAALPFPMPASVAAFAILLVLLGTGILKVDHIKEKCDFLLSNMAFFFIPAGVKVIEHVDLIKSVWWQFLLVCVVSTVVVFGVTAWTVMAVTRLTSRRKGEAE